MYLLCVLCSVQSGTNALTSAAARLAAVLGFIECDVDKFWRTLPRHLLGPAHLAKDTAGGVPSCIFPAAFSPGSRQQQLACKWRRFQNHFMVPAFSLLVAIPVHVHVSYVSVQRRSAASAILAVVCQRAVLTGEEGRDGRRDGSAGLAAERRCTAPSLRPPSLVERRPLSFPSKISATVSPLSALSAGWDRPSVD